MIVSLERLRQEQIELEFALHETTRKNRGKNFWRKVYHPPSVLITAGNILTFMINAFQAYQFRHGTHSTKRQVFKREWEIFLSFVLHEKNGREQKKTARAKRAGQRNAKHSKRELHTITAQGGQANTAEEVTLTYHSRIFKQAQYKSHLCGRFIYVIVCTSVAHTKINTI